VAPSACAMTALAATLQSAGWVIRRSGVGVRRVMRPL
jgi:hypothetical protein